MPFKQFRRNRLYRNAIREIQRRKRSNAISEIDHMVARYGDKIPHLGISKSEIMEPMQRAQQYISRIVRLIPGPVELSPSNWNANPLINALCTSIDRMDAFLSSNRTLQSFFRETDADEAIALLKSHQEEKLITGVGKVGEIAQRGVLQTAVSFEDHEIIAPAGQLSQSRDTIRRLLLTELFDRAAEQIESLRSWKTEIEEQQFRMKTKLGIDLEERGEDHPDVDSDALKTYRELERKKKELRDELESPHKRTAFLVSLLLNPEEHLKAEPRQFHLDRLGIKVKNASDERINTFTVASFSVDDTKRWVAAWVKIPRKAVTG